MNKYIVVGLILLVVAVALYFLLKEDKKSLLENLDKTQIQPAQSPILGIVGGLLGGGAGNLLGGGAGNLLGGLLGGAANQQTTVKK